jgi:hypothetical protein
VREAVFAGKQIEKFALDKIAARLAAALAELAWFAEDFFVGNSPSGAGYRKREQ